MEKLLLADRKQGRFKTCSSQPAFTHFSRYPIQDHSEEKNTYSSPEFAGQ